jgi:non-homologous end joining protein Ku
VIRPLDRLLVMDVLRYPSEVHPAAAWATELRDSAATSEEMHLVRALIDAASGPLDWSKYRDTNAEEMTALIEAKIAGQPMTAPAEEPMANMQLLDALKQSVAAARKSVPTQVISRKLQSRRRTT